MRAQSSVPTFMVVLTDLPVGFPAESLRAVLDPFVRAAIPAGIILDARTDGAGATQADLAIRALLRHAVLDRPNLLEPIPWSAPLSAAPPYFQMRLASQAVAGFKTYLAPPGSDPGQALKPVTVASRVIETQARLDGVRVAGLRNVLMLPERPAPPRIAPCGNGIVCGSGGLPVSLGVPPPGLADALAADAAAHGNATLILSIASRTDTPAETLNAQARRIVYQINTFRDRSRASARLPREMILRNLPEFTRLMALQLVAPPAGDVTAVSAFDDFSAMLDRAGLAFSVTPADGPLALSPWLRLDNGPGAFHGLDGDGLRHLATDITLDGDAPPMTRLDAGDATRDTIVAITPAAYASRASRNALLAAIDALAARPVTRIAGLRGFADRTRPADPVFDLMRATRDSKAAARPDPPPPGTHERAALMADARLAWSYVERTEHPRTGLCPSTAELGDNAISSFPFLTMWDYGSLILATLSAHQIGLIDDADFLARSARLIRGLSAVRIGAFALPRSEIRIGAPDEGKSEFNACDTGRLLVALRALRQALPNPVLVDRAVAQWDLGKVIVGRRLQSHDGKDFIEFHASHCGSYAARAFGLWGFDVESPHAAMQGETETDARMNLLYTVANFGVLGAEPLLMETVELSPTKAVDYLSDVLFAAQFRSYTDTGKLFCVSEGPLPHPPWFSYQGLQLNDATPRWDVVTIENNPEFRTEQFRADNFVVSSKAAFLWAATRPHPYSSRLLDHVRRGAVIPDFGFAAGIYQKTGKPTRNYSDINTNGVILQAIAYMLRDRQPRLIK